MQATRKELEEEYKRLRNGQQKKPKEHHGTRARNIYWDHLNESDTLARMKSDAELAAAIKRMKESE